MNIFLNGTIVIKKNAFFTLEVNVQPQIIYHPIFLILANYVILWYTFKLIQFKIFIDRKRNHPNFFFIEYYIKLQLKTKQNKIERP